MHWPLQILLLALVLTAAVTDLRRRRIPNWLTFSALVLALGAHAVLAGLHGVSWSLLGATFAGLVYLVPYLFGWMGGGDVKLMTAAGSILGPQVWLHLFFWTALCAGALAVGAILLQSGLQRTITNLRFMLGELLRFRSPRASNPALDIRGERATTMPHGAAIAIASIIVLSGR